MKQKSKTVLEIINNPWFKITKWFHEFWGIDDWIGLTILIFGAAYFFFPIADDKPGLFWKIFRDMHAEMVGIGVTVIILGNADEAIRKKVIKKQLINQLRSTDNGFALEALRQLDEEGWTNDGSLATGINLTEANLGKGSFINVHLDNATLTNSNLSETYFRDSSFRDLTCEKANFASSKIVYSIFDRSNFILSNFDNCQLINLGCAETNFENSSMVGAKLIYCDFKNANLSLSNFAGALIVDSNLDGANLAFADLREAKIFGVSYDENTKWIGAKYNRYTMWPEGFDPEEAGCVQIY